MRIPTYKVTRITIDKLIHFHVVNIKTNITHSSYRSCDIAMTTMRDLNKMVRSVT